jgi:multidrug efflux pump subunit AcrA (membrane-fusion protein)
MKKWTLLCMVILLLLVPVACASPQAAETEPAPPMPGAAPDMPPPGSPQIETLSPSQTETSMPVITASGHLSFVQDVKLVFGTSGQVAQVNVSELNRVTKGQELARLDTTSLEQAVKTAEIALKSAESDRELAEDGIKSAQNSVATIPSILTCPRQSDSLEML